MFTMNAAAVATIAASLKELLYFFGWIYFSVKKIKIRKSWRRLPASIEKPGATMENIKESD